MTFIARVCKQSFEHRWDFEVNEAAAANRADHGGCVAQEHGREGRRQAREGDVVAARLVQRVPSSVLRVAANLCHVSSMY